MISVLVICGVLFLFGFFFLLIVLARKYNEEQRRRAGRRGEEQAHILISSCLREDDYLFENVEIECEGKRAEFDSIVINKCGVFIFEVKAYSGWLVGDEDDYMWMKYHESNEGNTYVKEVKNPIKQVKREIYILSKYLKEYGVDVWVNGYAIVFGAEVPFKSDYVIYDGQQLDRTIHSRGGKGLSEKSIERIRGILA